MAIPQKKEDTKFTYADYLKWPDEERWELISGAAYNMTPAPGRKHQEISMEISRQLASYLKGKSCKVYSAPFDVVLPETYESENESTNVVQPDIIVICDKSKLTDKGCTGAPDLVIEITSPSTASKDMKLKFNLYERSGVHEYWIVNPADEIIMVYKIGADQKYQRSEIYSKEDSIKVGIFDDLQIDLKSVFPESLPQK